MTDLRALVQAFLDADDEFTSAQRAVAETHVVWQWKMVNERLRRARADRDEAFAAMRAAVREGN